MKDAQNEIRLKEVALKEIDGINIGSSDMNPETSVNCEKGNYNFMKKKKENLLQ